MIRTVTTIALLTCLASPAIAQGMRPGDRVMTAAELTETLSGMVVEFFDGSKSRYRPDGGYAYTYTDDGPAWTGQYTTHDDSTVCVAFDNGSSRCDTFVFSGERLTLIIQDGTRFPVRERAAE
ncbi:MAG: hypothetical protein HKO95_04375 [Rhodobacteraceae bacterium]|nr:hypothetical protein [Alphaproteobacteria bacterium]MBT8476458.1 hypothetical protein [Alphaproteobacteria bacterium]NNK65952.1 hypothetical protein [Paracoccaceae bacterium]